MNNNKAWQGRFKKNNDQFMEQFNASISFDQKLFKQDIEVSLAHSEMLASVGILTKAEKNLIHNGLLEIQNEMINGHIEFKSADEDIHMAIEKLLTEKIGSVGGKLHTARSRNDQVSTDIRLYVKEAINKQINLLTEFLTLLITLAENNQKIILPGFTHLQSAQPITLAYYFISYFCMFERDISRLIDCKKRMNKSPLGSGAMAGVNYMINRKMTAKKLGFDDITLNAMDGVSDRDFIIEFLSTMALIGMHLSRLSEEMIIWSNKFFDFIDIDDTFATGSSIMPNKKNPDASELIRGKTGRLYGNLISVLTVLKSLPLAYNKDMQEDKEPLFDSVDTIKLCLNVIIRMLPKCQFKSKNMKNACEKGFLQATDVADYLVKKGLPFREAHYISGEIVLFLEENNKLYQDMTIADFKKFSSLFTEDIKDLLKLETLIKNKQSEGSTSFEEVKKQIEKCKKMLSKLR